MAMSRRMRREVAKSRELLWHLLEGKKCCFCRKPLLDSREGHIRFGNATAPPLDLNITIHHHDGNHGNNTRQNRRIGHESCHKAFEAARIFRSWRARKAA